MGRFKAWLKKYWWLVLLGLLTAGVTLWLIFRPRKGNTVPAVTFSNKVREKIIDAQTEAKIEKLKIKAKVDEKRRELEVIKKVDDGLERRKILADFLDKNL